MQKLVLLFLFIQFSSCGVAKTQREDSAAIIPESSDKIVFLVFKMTKHTGSQSSIELLSKTTANGKMKKGNEKHINPDNFLTVDIQPQGQPSETLLINHPLYKVVEYVGEGNKYTSKKVEADEAEFFFRVQAVGATTIRISETLKNNSKTELITLTI
jgi:hypothetical protein